MLNTVDDALNQLRTAKTQLEEVRRQLATTPAAESAATQSSEATVQVSSEATRRIKEGKPIHLLLTCSWPNRLLEKAFSCTICVDYFDTPYTLQCGTLSPLTSQLVLNSASLGHTFCKDCITTWFGRQKSCPGCRRDIIQRPIPAYTVEVQGKALYVYDKKS